MKSRVVAAGLMFGLTIGAGACASQEAPSDYGPITADSWFHDGDKKILTDAHRAAVTDLVGRGITAAAGIELVLLEGSQTFRCDETTTLTANGPGPMYCAGSLVVNAKFVNVELPELTRAATNDPDKQQEIKAAGERYVVGHELGHGIQDIQHAIDAPPNVYQPSKEPQADCYSGRFLQGYAPNSLKDVELLLAQFPKRDLAHGSPEVRIAAVNLGASGSDCIAQEILALRDSIETQVTPSPTPA